MIDRPTFVRIEYFNPNTAEWQRGHAGINLMNPAAYIAKLGKPQRNRQGVMTKPGAVARAVDPDTGEIEYTEGADLL